MTDANERYGPRWGERIYSARWEAWLYELHSAEELRRWARRLGWFRYCRAVGGHANDGDALRVAVRVGERADLLAVMGSLRIRPRFVPPDVPQPVAGVAYAPAEFEAFPSLIPGFPGLAQPGHVEINGEKALVWVRSDRLELSIADPGQMFDVTERAVQAAVAIEPLLDGHAIIDPPVDDPHCVCPKYYPGLWR
ncbi:hypothetical protein [Actinocrispum sp. NPDC049592]|uniref:hypothetical protein n=1 Tax=Actinocrispum sp. NPDC049592 TaxID=3154835 RepID=UPI00341BAB28